MNDTFKDAVAVITTKLMTSTWKEGKIVICLMLFKREFPLTDCKASSLGMYRLVGVVERSDYNFSLFND